MKTTDLLETKINRLPKGHIFTYSDIISDPGKKEAAIKALNRMAQSGKIAKLSKGKYYRPEETVFGKLQPDQYQVVKDLLEENGKVIGYLTGLSIYNKLGLTTQVSNTIQVGSNDIRPTFRRERYTISFIRQKNTITKENIPVMQLLDAIRYIKKIPDAAPASAVKRLMAIIEELPENNLPAMARLAQKYPPQTRALLGAMLEETGNGELATTLKPRLNPITVYKYPEIAGILQSAERWNIK